MTHATTEIGTIAVIGAGLAGAKAAEALRKAGFDGRIVLVGEEPEPPYLRPPLSKDYLRGESELAEIVVQPEAWYAEHQVELRTRARILAIEPASREVVLGDGERLAVDRLLLATGAAPRTLPVPGADLDGIFYLRTVADADAIRAAVADADRAAVIGGGWIGTEVAASLRQLGLPVALIIDGAAPLERVLGPEVGAVYADLHASHGVELVRNQRAVAFRGRTAVEAVETADGTRVEADLVVVGIGARPRTELAEAAGLDVRDGIVVDEYLETSVPGIFAAGDVAAAWHPRYGTRLRVEHWDNARRQGRAAARNLLGAKEAYDRIPYFYSDQYELSMEYTGYAPAWDRVVFRGDPSSRAFVAFWLREGRVVAGMNVNVSGVTDAIRKLVAAGRPVDAARLMDPAVPLDDLDALVGPAETAAP